MFYNFEMTLVEAELRVSEDGKNFISAGLLNARPGGNAQPFTYSWASTMVEPIKTRYVRLYVPTPPNGKIGIPSFDVYGY